MAVKSQLSGELLPVKGVRSAAVASGIRYSDRLDLVLIELAKGAHLSGVFTRNAFCAAPVTIAREHLGHGNGRYLLINTGNANAGTGEQGIADALACCSEVASYVTQAGKDDIGSDQVLPFSTGVIGERLPVQQILQGIPRALAQLDPDGWDAAARGIMTTDTRPKAVSMSIDIAESDRITITGIAKGSGMIRPDMATMLAFIFTDAIIEQQLLDELLIEAVDQSFNRITVDGDTSTNDSCLLVSTSKSECAINKDQPQRLATFKKGLNSVFQQLAMELIRDAEGASKFVTIHVAGGADSEECLRVAYTIAESPLVKTALFASDPNWGRILAAIGRAGLDNLDIGKVVVYLGTTRLVENGCVASSYTEKQGQAEVDRDDINITVELARGNSKETVWTSDLSHDYIRINAEYRT